GHPGQAHRASLALAEWLCRTADRVDPARVRGPFRRLGRGTSAPDPASLCWLLQRHQNAPVIGQRCAGLSLRSADWNHKFTPDPWRASSPLCPDLGFRYTQARKVYRENQTRPPNLIKAEQFIRKELPGLLQKPALHIQSGIIL